MTEKETKYYDTMHPEYTMSRDYDRLVELVETGRVFGVLDYDMDRDGRDVLRDVVAILKHPDQEGHIVYWFTAGVRGMCYTHARTAEGFKAECERLNLEFIDPNPATC